MVKVWIDRPPIDQPHQLWVGKSTHLEDEKDYSLDTFYIFFFFYKFDFML